MHVLKDYLRVHEASLAKTDGARLAATLLEQTTPSINSLLQQLLELHPFQFVRYLPSFYPILVDLMHCDSKKIRETLREIFSQPVLVDLIGKALHDTHIS